MSTVRNLLVRIRLDVRRPRPTRSGRDAIPSPPVRSAEAPVPPSTTAIPRPSPPPPRRTPELAAVPPATPPSGRRVSKLAALTPVLGRQKAGQALWAPERLTQAERATAARILKEFQ